MCLQHQYSPVFADAAANEPRIDDKDAAESPLTVQEGLPQCWVVVDTESTHSDPVEHCRRLTDDRLLRLRAVTGRETSHPLSLSLWLLRYLSHPSGLGAAEDRAVGLSPEPFLSPPASSAHTNHRVNIAARHDRERADLSYYRLRPRNKHSEGCPHLLPCLPSFPSTSAI